MRSDPQVVDELRSLFLAGATPSRLIGHIIAHHATEDNLYSLIQSYFRVAFSTPILHVSPELMLEDPRSLSLASLNVHLVHQMLLTRPEWDVEHPPRFGSTSWPDGLKVRSDADLIEEVKPESLPELAGCWGGLDENARRCIQKVFGNAQALQERVQILARLAEQLQQQVNSLLVERNLEGDADDALVQTPQG